jgi:hypothetical protein
MATVNSKVIGPYAALCKRPYKLNYSINRIVYDTSDFFMSNNNYSIYKEYVKPLMEFFQDKNLGKICQLRTSPQTLNGLNLNGIGRRAQLTFLFRRFAQQCWVNTRSYTLENFHRMMFCPPVGFQSRYFKCDHPLCLNCHLRKAISYRKEILKSDPTNSAAIVLKVEIPFADELYGYLPVKPKTFSKFYRFNKTLNPKGKNSIGCSAGVAIHDKHPYTSTCFHALFSAEDLEMKYLKALNFAKKIESEEADYGTKVNVIKVTNKQELPYYMYNNCPMMLLAVSSYGFSDINLQNTVNAFFEEAHTKKLNRVKST